MSKLKLRYIVFTFKDFDAKFNTGVFKSTEPSSDDLDDVAATIQDDKFKGQRQRLVFYKVSHAFAS